MPTKNPTEYVFRAPKDAVAACLRDLRPRVRIGWKRQHGLPVRAFEDKGESLIFGIPANRNDIVVGHEGGHIGPSPVYARGTCALPFIPSYHVHVSADPPRGTRVVVLPLGTEVIVGSRHVFAHAGSEWEQTRVPPTTIEEYQILQQVGECLGEAPSMPPLRLPPGANVSTDGCHEIGLDPYPAEF